jgi:hypothetical protein
LDKIASVRLRGKKRGKNQESKGACEEPKNHRNTFSKPTEITQCYPEIQGHLLTRAPRPKLEAILGDCFSVGERQKSPPLVALKTNEPTAPGIHSNRVEGSESGRQAHESPDGPNQSLRRIRKRRRLRPRAVMMAGFIAIAVIAGIVLVLWSE